MAEYLGLDSVQSHMMIKLLDRKDKIPMETFELEAAAIFTDEQRLAGIEKLRKLVNAHSMGDLPQTILDSDNIQQIQILFTHLKENGINNVKFDVSLMRGFDYYTDIVFEVFDNHPDNNRSMFGGGRYDGLVGLFGVEPIATAGFGMGDVTMENFLRAHELVPELKSTVDVYVIPIGDTLRQVQGLAKIMRDEGVNVAVDVTDKKTEKQIKNADKNSVRYVMFVGEEELNQEQFKLKELDSGDEKVMSLERVITTVTDHRRRDEDVEL
jgi:histidyl-tRNA synthetase